MSSSRAREPIAAAALSLLVFGLGVFAFVPPFLQTTLQSIALTAAIGIGMTVALLLHWAYVGIAAHRLGRSALLWVAMAVLLFPVASIVGLILFYWFDAEGGRAAESRAA